MTHTECTEWCFPRVTATMLRSAGIDCTTTHKESSMGQVFTEVVGSGDPFQVVRWREMLDPTSPVRPCFRPVPRPPRQHVDPQELEETRAWFMSLKRVGGPRLTHV